MSTSPSNERFSVNTEPIHDVRINKLKKVFPEVWIEGKVQWDKLRETLGEFVENKNDESEEITDEYEEKVSELEKEKKEKIEPIQEEIDEISKPFLKQIEEIKKKMKEATSHLTARLEEVEKEHDSYVGEAYEVWKDQTNSVAEEVKDRFGEFKETAENIQQVVQNKVNDFSFDFEELPEPDVIDDTDDDSFVYDSNRDYLEQLKYYKKERLTKKEYKEWLIKIEVYKKYFQKELHLYYVDKYHYNILLCLQTSLTGS